MIFLRFFLSLYLFFLCGKRFLSFLEIWKPLTCGNLWSVALRPVPGPLVGWRHPPGGKPRPRSPCVHRTIKAAPRSGRGLRPRLTRSPGPKLPCLTRPSRQPGPKPPPPVPLSTACVRARHATGAARPCFRASAPVSVAAPVLLQGRPPRLTSLRLLREDLTDGTPPSTNSLTVITTTESLLR
jgi:hypothetical protein